MSRDRISPKAGWVDERRLPKGPNGRNLCRWCEVEVEPPRRTFCSDACVHEHKIRTQPAYARAQVEKRDRGVCALCGTDTNASRNTYARWSRSIERWRRRTFRRERIEGHWSRDARAVYNQVARMQGAAKKALGLHRGHVWEMDHTIPVVEGGGSCGLDNLRTLCIPCHRRVTAELAARRAEERKRAGPQQEMDV